MHRTPTPVSLVTGWIFSLCTPSYITSTFLSTGISLKLQRLKLSTIYQQSEFLNSLRILPAPIYTQEETTLGLLNISLSTKVAAPITVQSLPRLGVTILTALAGTGKARFFIVLFRGSKMRPPA